MSIFAVLDENNLVVNRVVANNLESAEAVSFANCVLETEATGNAIIGYEYSNGIFAEKITSEEGA